MNLIDWVAELEPLCKRVKDNQPGEAVSQPVITLSAAISLKRIADSLDKLAMSLDTTDKYGLTGTAAISMAVRDGIREGMGK